MRAAAQKNDAVFHQSISDTINREIFLTFDDGKKMSDNYLVKRISRQNPWVINGTEKHLDTFVFHRNILCHH